MDGEFRTKAEERTHLTKIIKEWNDNRLDMFALSLPDKDLEFNGVMRFYFQGSDNKVVTKCIRVSSKTIIADLMDTLVEKFCPDLKMLTHSNYELFECHEKGDTRKLGKSERPLLVQLSWHRDDREGRFLLKSASAKVASTFYQIGNDDGQLRRRLSRREKKEMKKQRKRQEARREKENKNHDDTAIAQQLYDEKPESSLTRSISNPEAVMKRKRLQKIQNRLKDFKAEEGQRGGTLKIFAETLKPEIPYKTILASDKQTSDKIVQDALEKFQLENENPAEYCLVMTEIPPGENPGPGRDSVVKDYDCPLAIQSSWPASRGFLTFHLRKKNTVSGFKKETKTAQKKVKDTQADRKAAMRLAHQSETDQDQELPYLTEIIPDETKSNFKPRVLKILPNLTVIGSSKVPTAEQYIQLYALDILPEHCFLENIDGEVTITPTNADALILVNEKRVYETTTLSSGSVIIFGHSLVFQFNDRSSGRLTPPNVRVRSPASGSRSPNESAQLSNSMSPVMRDERPSYSPMKFDLDELPGSRVDDEMMVETTFLPDGEIASSPVRKTDPSGGIPNRSSDSNDPDYNGEMQFRSGQDLSGPGSPQADYGLPLLPAALEFIDDAQDAFFAAIISEVNGAAVHFKLAPAYSLYLASHYMISHDFRPELGNVEHARVVGASARKMAIAIEKTVQENDAFAGSLAFWMANASELLHFLKQDTELSPLTQNAQGILEKSVQHAFRLLVLAMEDQLGLAMSAFLDPSETADIPENELDHILEDDLLERAESSDLLNWTSDERTFPVHDGRPITGEHWVSPAARIHLHGRPVMADVLYILSSAMSLLRRCRVNAALTIQLFSQLFHFINMWLFNKLVLETNLGLCTKAWGRRLRRRLGYVEAWAEKQGLELAADCHLCRIVQAAHLLDAPKESAEDIASISSTCFKLNSLQLRALLEMYRPDRGEHIIPPELIDNVVTVAEHTADELARSDGREVRLDEDEELQLPFLLPDEGYSCDIIRGVPAGLKEFLQSLMETGICRLTVNPTSSGLWTVHQEYYDDDDRGMPVDYEEQENDMDAEPKTIEVTLQKGSKGLGLSIVAAKGPHMEHLGIYIKGVVEGGIAYQNGQLAAGDQIISVNGMSLVEVSQETAAKLMGQTGPTVVLEISKDAAVHHGLADLLSQPSPATSPSPFLQQEKSPYRDPKDGGSTIDEYSPQIRTQSWIANHGNQYEHDEEEERRRREEEMYQEEEDRRQEQMQREQDALGEEERRLYEQEQKERLRKLEEERLEREEFERVQKQHEEEERQKERERLEEIKRQKEWAAEQQRIEHKERQRLDDERRAEEERQRLEEERRAEEERLRMEEEEKKEKQRLEEQRLQAEREEEERKRIEEGRKRAEERRKFEQRQREYETRLRIMEEQQKKREKEEAARREAERREQEELRKKEELEELERLKKERQRQEEARIMEQKKKEEEERRLIEEERRNIEKERKRKEEERRLLEEERKRLEDERKRFEDEQRRHYEEIRRKEEARKREEEIARRKPDVNSRNHRGSSPRNRYNSDDFGNLDDLPPPPEDLLLEDYGVQKDQEEKLERKIQSQLAAERQELRQAEHEQSELHKTNIEEYEETNIDNVDDEMLQSKLMEERLRARVSAGKSHSFYSSDEDPYEIELEFQRRLQQENERMNRERRLGDYYSDDVTQKMRNEREHRAEKERKLKLMIDDHDRRSAYRNSEKKTVENTDVDDQPRRVERLNIRGQPQANTKPEDAWFAMQKKNHLDQKREQERIRKEQEDLEEQDRQRKLRDIKAQKEQEQKMMEEYRRHKELADQTGVGKKPWQKASVPGNYDRTGDKKEVVKEEFKEKAIADYERRRATLDKDIERAEREKRIRNMEVRPPQVAKKPPPYRPAADDDEEAPPRPPPPSSISPMDIVRSSSSTSPSPQPSRGDRFSFSAKTISNVTAQSSARQNSVNVPNRVFSPTGQYQPRSASSSRSPSREDPASLDFSQKMKMFGIPQKNEPMNNMRSTFSKKQRDYMD